MTSVITGPTRAEAFEAWDSGELIGSGSSRHVYRVPGSDWVYKYDNDSGVNELEYDNYQLCRNIMPDGTAIPEMQLISMRNGSSVLAVRYVEGKLIADSVCPWHGYTCEHEIPEFCLWEWSATVDLPWECSNDLHAWNVIVGLDGILYFIDVA
jgi:hypothetical protein